MTNIQNYLFEGSYIMNEETKKSLPRIANIRYNELGKEILKIHNEKFKGIKYIEDIHEYKENQPISYSNTPRLHDYNQILRKEFPRLNAHALNIYEILEHWNYIPELKKTHADSDSVSLYPKKGPNEYLRQLVLNIIGKQKTDIPLIVSGLGVDKSDNDYGFKFTETDYLTVIEAPFLQIDCKLAVKDGQLVESDNGIQVDVPSDQSGLRRLYRDGPVLGAGYNILHYSDGASRVQIFQDPSSKEKNLEAKLKQFQKEKDKKLAEISRQYTSFKEESIQQLKALEEKIEQFKF